MCIYVWGLAGLPAQDMPLGNLLRRLAQLSLNVVPNPCPSSSLRNACDSSKRVAVLPYFLKLES